MAFSLTRWIEVAHDPPSCELEKELYIGSLSCTFECFALLLQGKRKGAKYGKLHYSDATYILLFLRK